MSCPMQITDEGRKTLGNNSIPLLLLQLVGDDVIARPFDPMTIATRLQGTCCRSGILISWS